MGIISNLRLTLPATPYFAAALSLGRDPFSGGKDPFFWFKGACPTAGGQDSPEGHFRRQALNGPGATRAGAGELRARRGTHPGTFQPTSYKRGGLRLVEPSRKARSFSRVSKQSVAN